MALFKKKTKKVEDAPVASPEKTTRVKKVASTPTSTETRGGRAFRVLLKPVTSEKAAMLESHGSYAFKVATRATKEEIKRAVFQVYGVMPTAVRTMHMQGKHVRFGTYSGKRHDWKKAIVTLKKGDSIRIHEGI